MINLKRGRAFTLIELLVVISIVGILMTLVIVTVVPVQRKGRDSKRKSDVNLFLSGVELYKADFKVYPNPTLYLGNYGTSGNGGANSNLSLSNDVPTCNALPIGTTNNFISQGNNPNAAYLDANPVTLKSGFTSANHFLICLKYIDRVLSDANQTLENGYQFRVSYDYTDAVVTAKLENAADPDAGFLFNTNTLLKRYYQGGGKTVRQLDDDSDTTSFYSSLVSGSPTDGKYLYQCVKKSADGSTFNVDDRSLTANDPLPNNGTTWIANSLCQNLATGLDVKQAY